MTTAKIATKNLHRPTTALTGNNLFTLTVGWLTVLGMLPAPRKGAAEKALPAKTITAVYASGSMLRHHKANGLFTSTAPGRYSLTTDGREYFTGRKTDKRTDQNVDPKALKEMVTVLKSGGSFAGVAFEPVTVKL